VRRSAAVSVGVDIGGTFTDVVGVDHDGGIRLLKVPTTPSDPSAAVRHALAHMEAQWGVPMHAITRFVHGTTVATNAVLERKGGRVGLLTTAGFRDVLEIGRSYRRNIYDLAVQASAPVFLVPRHLRQEVLERMSATGEAITPLDHASLRAAIASLLAQQVDAIAVCFLFSFLDPTHEREAARMIREMAPEMLVSLSSEVDPSFREYERTCITAFDAYVKPVLERYLAHMEGDLARSQIAAPLQVMQSRGGLMASSVARQRPVRLFLSGPAAGVIGAQAAAMAVDRHDLITCDIGGTSCDIALIQSGVPVIRSEGMIDGYAVRVPMVDVNAIGAGGGSIAWIDGGGGLRVGPHSAGADPGPACYGRGGEDATVTDASLVLGYVNGNYFAGGSMRLDPKLATAAIENKVARPLGLSVRDAALGIHRVLNAQMAEGIRLVSVRRGCDPRRFALVALGGGGPLHATALAAELGIESIIVPRFPGVLSACGLLCAPVEHEVSSAFHRQLADVAMADVRAVLARLDRRCAELMAAEVRTGGYRVTHSADVCYVGQSHFIEVALEAASDDALANLYRDFLAAHDRLYGHGEALPARIVNLRSIARTPATNPMGANAYVPEPGNAAKGARPISLQEHDSPVTAAIFERNALAVGTEIAGPAVIEQADTTTLIEPGWRARVLPDGTLLIERNDRT
jgi:N-methylhydantoinase A/oxoprolinase/acetone carboxylase beta subunit